MIRPREVLLAALLLGSATAQAQFGATPASAGFVSVPAQPRAEAAFDLLLTVPVVIGGEIQAPSPEVRVSGLNIDVLLRERCSGTGCGATALVPAQATVPAVAPGDYRVRVFSGTTLQGQPVISGQLRVTARAAAPIEPATGIWGTPSMPGSGLTLQRRGDTLVIALFSYDAPAGTGKSTWALGSAALRESAIGVLMERYRGGNCLGCVEVGTGSPTGRLDGLSIEFLEPRQGRLRLNGGVALPLVHLDAGASLPSLDAASGTRERLQLPSFEGRWLFSLNERSAPIDATFGPAEIFPDRIVFSDPRPLAPEQERFRIECLRAVSAAATCVLASEISDGTRIVATRRVAEFASGSIVDGYAIGVTTSSSGMPTGESRAVRVPVRRNR